MRALSLLVASLVLCGCASLKPNLIDLQKNADAAYARGDYINAAHGYEKLADAMPNDAGVRYLLANSLARQGNTSAAITAYRETLVRDSQHARAWHNLLQTQLRDARDTAEELLYTLNEQQPHAALARARAEGVLMLNQNTDTSSTSAKTEPVSAAELETPEEP